MLNIILQSGLMSSMKEACQAMIDMRRNRARGHRLKHSHEVCSGLTITSGMPWLQSKKARSLKASHSLTLLGGKITVLTIK